MKKLTDQEVDFYFSILDKMYDIGCGQDATMLVGVEGVDIPLRYTAGTDFERMIDVIEIKHKRDIVFKRTVNMATMQTVALGLSVEDLLKLGEHQKPKPEAKPKPTQTIIIKNLTINIFTGGDQ